MEGCVNIGCWKLNQRLDQNRKDQGWKSLEEKKS